MPVSLATAKKIKSLTPQQRKAIKIAKDHNISAKRIQTLNKLTPSQGKVVSVAKKNNLSVENISALKLVKKYKTPFVIQHSQGTPENMQIKPSYKNELLDIYDFFVKNVNF